MKNQRENILMANDIALRTRRKIGYDYKSSLCIYDAVEKLGVELRFADNPGMEGVYFKDSVPKIIIGSQRPAGRKVYTCAHELGHHFFNHGTKIDEIKLDNFRNQSTEKEEFLADCFASFFLMPKSAISKAFTIRGWSPENCSMVEFFTIAGWFGVSYEAIINQICFMLKMISISKEEELKKVKPKDIRALLVGNEIKEDVLLVDIHWNGNEKAIDIQVGDFVVLPLNTKFEGKCVEYIHTEKRGTFYKGITPGIGKFFIPEKNWSSFVRVSRRNYVGRSIFRHMEEVEDE